MDIDGYKAVRGFTTPCITTTFAWKKDMAVNPSKCLQHNSSCIWVRMTKNRINKTSMYRFIDHCIQYINYQKYIFITEVVCLKLKILRY